jgi:outer membrane protein TolC
MATSFEGEEMKSFLRCASHLPNPRLVAVFLLFSVTTLAAEPLPLRRAVELALSHSTTAGVASADEQRAFASYREARNQFIPQFIVGSGLGKSWGFPLSLEGSAPAIVNLNSQSALINPALRDFVHAAKTETEAASIRTKDQRNQVIQDVVLSYAELSKWEILLRHLGQEQESALHMEQIVDQRIQEGVDKPLARNQAKLITARVRLRMTEAQGAIDVLRNRLSHLTGLRAPSI